MSKEEEVLQQMQEQISHHTKKALSIVAALEGKEFQWREQGIIRGLSIAKEMLEKESGVVWKPKDTP